MWNDRAITTARPTQKEVPGKLRGILTLSSILLLILLSTLYLFGLDYVRIINFKTLEIIQRTVESPNNNKNVVTVAIDEESLEKYGQWPWPRLRLAKLLETIKALGAESIGIVMLLPEQDRTSIYGSDLSVTVQDGALLESSSDMQMAEVLKDGPFVVGYEFLFEPKEMQLEKCSLRPVSFNVASKNGHVFAPVKFHRAEGVICNYKILAEAINRSGFLNGTPDLDGVLRRLPLLISYQEQLYPSFALSLLMQYKHHDLLILREDYGFVPRLSLADLDIPMDEQGNFMLGYHLPEDNGHLSAVHILEGNAKREDFESKIALVGLTASGLGKEFATSSSPITSLLNLHKHSIETLLSGFVPVRRQYFPVYEVCVSLIICLILAFFSAKLSTLWVVALHTFFLGIFWASAGLCYQSSGYLFSPLLPSVSLVLGCFLVLVVTSNYFQDKAKTEADDTLVLLKSSENNLQSILNTIPDIVFRLDPKGRITFISPAIGKYLPPSEPLLGRKIFELVAPEDQEKARYCLNERRTGERATHDLELKLLLSNDDNSGDGVQFFSVSAEGIYEGYDSESPVFLGTQGIVRDISDRKKLEMQLIQAQKMEAVGNLASRVAHDLNNILCGLVSYPDLLLLDIPQEDALHGKISLIQKSGKKAAVIVQDLLTLARRSVENNEICNLNTIVSDYLASMEFKKVKARYPKVEIQTSFQKNLQNVEGSPVHLSKVLMNLIHNSLESMAVKGKIDICTQNIVLETKIDGYEEVPEGVYVCLSVKDNGIGIPLQERNRIFEPFYTRKEMSRSGTGLGMTVIWATTKDHGGYIDIVSQEGKGTNISIYLPSTKSGVEPVSTRFILEDNLGTETILLVDDIPEQLEVAGSMLSKLGYTVLAVDDGDQALQLLSERQVDLVVLDMIMREHLDGLETYREILKISPQQKAIITSGFSESEKVRELQRLGAGGYVQKPYSMETLALAVRRELDRE